MRKITIIAVMLAAFSACSHTESPDPVKDGIRAKIAETVGPDATIIITSYERTDSTTFGEELEHRLRVLELRRQQNLINSEKYIKEGKVKNAARRKADAEKDLERIASLESIRERLADSLDITAYYDVKFSGKAETESKTTEFNGYYAAVTPDGKVYNIQTSPKGLHKPMGHVIPGYSDLFPEQSAEDAGSGAE